MTRKLVLSALKDLEQLRSRLDELLATYDSAAREGASEAWLRPSGRLTDAGVWKIRSMIDEDCTDTEIAREISVTPAAIRPHRAKYIEEKSRSRSRSKSS